MDCTGHTDVTSDFLTTFSMAPETSPEKKNAVPDTHRGQLEALRQKLAASGLRSVDDIGKVEEKGTVLKGLRALSRDIEAGRATGVTKDEVDALHDAIEAPMLMSTRPLEETIEDVAGAGFDAIRGMNPEVKKVVLATAAVGGAGAGLFGLSKLWKSTKRVAADAWDTTLDLGEKGVKATGQFLKWLVKTAAVAGVGALTFMGVQNFMAKQGPVENPTKP